MNKSDISAEKIIDLSLKLLRETGSADLNMRAVAAAAGTAVGSLYNYFPTKADLCIALIQRVWGQAFGETQMPPMDAVGYPDFVAAIYGQVYQAQRDYHNFFLSHRTLIGSGGKAKGRNSMGRYMARLHMAFLQQLQADTYIRAHLWTPDFTPEQLVDFTFSGMLTALSKDEAACTYLCKILEKLLYP